jgi:succinate dehydrogenase/fumarate reductase cytochrome b subunit
VHAIYSEITTVTWVSSSHHVLGIEHLLSEFRNGNSAVLLAAAGGKRSETSHEEVETGERN